MWSFGGLFTAPSKAVRAPRTTQVSTKQEAPLLEAAAVSQVTLPVTNDEGAPVVALGNESGRLYCGRKLGEGQCGPHSGPQCGSCKRFQDEREECGAVLATPSPSRCRTRRRRREAVPSLGTSPRCEDDRAMWSLSCNVEEEMQGLEVQTLPFLAAPEDVEEIQQTLFFPEAAAEGLASDAVVDWEAVEATGEVPLEPRTGTVDGGTHLRWVGESAPPAEVLIGGRYCAALRGGIFVTPMCREAPGADTSGLDVVLEDGTGARTVYKRGWAYWTPGSIASVVPEEGPIMGGQEVTVYTTDLGEPISEVRIGGVQCELVVGTTSTHAIVRVPAVELDGPVSVEVSAPNGNGASAEKGFQYFTPEFFGVAGSAAAVSADQLTVTRMQGLNRAVCIGGFPMRRVAQGRYFEVHVEEMCKSSRTLAVGVCVAPAERLVQGGQLRVSEASELERAWVAGYDRGGALFIADKVESKIPPAAWRPARSVAVGSRIGVLWSSGEAPDAGAWLTIFQDGVERVRLQATGRLPMDDEEIYGVVDVQGSVKAVRLVKGGSPCVQAGDVEAEDQ